MIRVFGITGTNGKTTVSWMLRSILEQKAPCGLIGTIGHLTGDKCYVSQNTTPGRELIRELFDEMAEHGTEQCVMEVSSHGIAQNRIENVIFAGTGFTNLSRDHLDYHNSMEEYFQVKRKLLAENDTPSAINTDDHYGSRLHKELVSCRGSESVKSCSVEYPDADFYGKILNSDICGTLFRIYEKGRPKTEIHLSMAGRHFVSNAVIASAMARQAGMSYENIKKGIESIGVIAGRMERIGDPGDTLGIVDYAHTPDSLEKLLETVYELKRGKLLCVFGCGGLRDKGKRRLMGEIAGKYCDYCVITNDNPRGEPPENIVQAIEEGLYPTGGEYCVILDRYQAIKRAVSLSDKWDIIVVAGKGHETYQSYGNERVPFNDKEVLKELLEKKYEKTYD